MLRGTPSRVQAAVGDRIPSAGHLLSLFVFMVMVNNWDLKTTNNVVYEVPAEGDDPQSSYVVKDLGGSLGKTAWPFPVYGMISRDLDASRSSTVSSAIASCSTIRGRGEPHLVASVTPADVRWMCDLLARLSPQQSNDTFRAGGYTETEAGRYIQRLREKIAEGQNIG